MFDYDAKYDILTIRYDYTVPAYCDASNPKFDIIRSMNDDTPIGIVIYGIRALLDELGSEENKEG